MNALDEITPYPADPRYGVTRDGRAFRIVRAKFGRPVPSELRPWRSRGYPYVSLSGNKKIAVHAMVAETFLEARPQGREVAHGDGVRHHNADRNLRWATRRQNLADRLLHGTDNRGERHGCAKLTGPDVIAIRRRRGAGERNGALAAEFGVTPATICDITHGRSWTHV